MILKGIYAEKPALFQLSTLLFMVLAGAVFSSFVGMGLFFMFQGVSADIMQYPDMMRMLQFVSAIGTFLLPSLCTAWLCSNNPKKYLCIGKIPNGKILLLTLISMFLLSPSISLTGLLNKQMELPAFMGPIEDWMRIQETTAEHLTELLLSGNNLFTLIMNLIVIAIAAGITEEFLFRGALQRILSQWASNYHVTIWGAAFLFSVFHMQFFGFLPRLLLGAYFGYLLYWGKNIWIPVFAHFTNNAFAVISMSDNQLKENEFITGDISQTHLLPYSLLAIFTLFIFIVVNRVLKKDLQKM